MCPTAGTTCSLQQALKVPYSRHDRCPIAGTHVPYSRNYRCITAGTTGALQQPLEVPYSRHYRFHAAGTACYLQHALLASYSKHYRTIYCISSSASTTELYTVYRVQQALQNYILYIEFCCLTLITLPPNSFSVSHCLTLPPTA